MQQWRVSDGMTREVVTLPDHALTAEVAALLSARGISGVPIVDGREVVVGVVTWPDILRRIDFGLPTGGTEDRQLTWDAAGRTAANLMDAVPATITPGGMVRVDDKQPAHVAELAAGQPDARTRDHPRPSRGRSGHRERPNGT
jgi:CBS-domain-containing membrane protein